MRKIKFRGYSSALGWVSGDLVKHLGHVIIYNGNIFIEVEAKSVGQYITTYLGKNIFEGDIVEVTETDGYKSSYKGVALYDSNDCRFVVQCENGEMIPITGEKQEGYLGMGATYEFYYQYKVVGKDYETKTR